MGNASRKVVPSAAGDLSVSVENKLGLVDAAFVSLSSSSVISATNGALNLLNLSGGEESAYDLLWHFDDEDSDLYSDLLVDGRAVPGLCSALARHAASDKLVAAVGLFIRNICAGYGGGTRVRRTACIPAVPLLIAALEARLVTSCIKTRDQQAAIAACAWGLGRIAIDQESVCVAAIDPLECVLNWSRADASLIEAVSSAIETLAKTKQVFSSLSGLLKNLKRFVREPRVCAQLMLAIHAVLTYTRFDVAATKSSRALVLRDGVPLIRAALILHSEHFLRIRRRFGANFHPASKACLTAIRILRTIAEKSDDLGRERCGEVAPTLLNLVHQVVLLRNSLRSDWRDPEVGLGLVKGLCGVLRECAKRVRRANAVEPAPWVARCSGQLNELLLMSNRMLVDGGGNVWIMRETIRRMLRQLGLKLPSTCVALRVLPQAELGARLLSCLECWDAKPRRSCSHNVHSGTALRECSICMRDESMSEGADRKWVALSNCGHVFHERCMLKWARTETAAFRAAMRGGRQFRDDTSGDVHCPCDRRLASVQVFNRNLDAERELHVFTIGEEWARRRGVLAGTVHGWSALVEGVDGPWYRGDDVGWSESDEGVTDNESSESSESDGSAENHVDPPAPLPLQNMSGVGALGAVAASPTDSEEEHETLALALQRSLDDEQVTQALVLQRVVDEAESRAERRGGGVDTGLPARDSMAQ